MNFDVIDCPQIHQLVKKTDAVARQGLFVQWEKGGFRLKIRICCNAMLT